jgi:tetraacyldisaccharide 4'-kinase
MKLSTPRWWYVRRGAPMPVTRAILTPVSWLWAAVTARKLARVIPADAGVPVICVGNLTVGGAGKTPVVRALLTRLAEQGVDAHGLSRGHGGRLAGPVRVDPGLHSASDVGDEPLMMAQALPFWIARDRLAGARAAAAAGAQLVVMDDGHQNPSVAKSLSLVVVDGETRDDEWPFGDGAVFPAGPMREPLKAGLARADAVVLLLPADLAEPYPALLTLLAPTPVLIARLVRDAPPPQGPVVAFAGIGKPWKFERALKAAGVELAEFAPFADHHVYDEGTLKALERRAADQGAVLVTTEKDWVRLSPAWQAKVTAWPVRVGFEDEAALDALLDRAIPKASKERASRYPGDESPPARKSGPPRRRPDPSPT